MKESKRKGKVSIWDGVALVYALLFTLGVTAKLFSLTDISWLAITSLIWVPAVFWLAILASGISYALWNLEDGEEEEKGNPEA